MRAFVKKLIDKIGIPQSDAGIKLVRTVAQAIGGLLVSLALKYGISLDQDTAFGLVYPLCVAVWVAFVDALVRYVHPGFEKLNLISKAPTY